VFWVALVVLSSEFACKSEGTSIAFWVALAAPAENLHLNQKTYLLPSELH
jgi:hypothetical protein